jgi:hypothetical protein
MFAATLEWLREGTVDGQSEGVVLMGYQEQSEARSE